MAGSISTTRPTCSPIADARCVAIRPPNECPTTSTVSSSSASSSSTRSRTCCSAVHGGVHGERPCPRRSTASTRRPARHSVASCRNRRPCPVTPCRQRITGPASGPNRWTFSITVGCRMVVIDAQALAKRFGDVDAVQSITFAVEAGERLAYIGPNGAGKSTSIKMLTGILYPTGGSATVLGLVPWRQRRQLAHRIGTLFGQRSQLWFQLSPRETLALLGRIYRLSRAETERRIASLGELLDATELLDRPVRTLSLGERMRCELAASVLHEPEILFLDEPTIGLDLIAKTRFRDLILRLNEERATTIFLTSHDVSDIEQVARRVI